MQELAIETQVKNDLQVDSNQARGFCEVWLNDYNELQDTVAKCKDEGMTLEQVAKKLGGHNLDTDVCKHGFDINYGSLLATVNMKFKVNKDLTCYVDGGIYEKVTGLCDNCSYSSMMFETTVDELKQVV